MWVFVFFDLPTNTKAQRKVHTDFRKRLLADGFMMMQFSVYSRYTASSDIADTHIRRIREIIPVEGKVVILKITDKQYSNMQVFFGGVEKPETPKPPQLELF